VTREELGYVLLDRHTLQRAEERAQAEASSAVVSRAVVTGKRRSEAEQRFWQAIDARASSPSAPRLLPWPGPSVRQG
jgi:hypothetical protein